MFENKSLKYNTDILTFDNKEVIWPEQVQIGNQIWTTQNLAIDDGGSGIFTASVTYNKLQYHTEYYYTYNAAVRIVENIDGWHLPTTNECRELGSAVGGTASAGKKLKSIYGWHGGKNGDGSYIFAACPVGYMYKGERYNPDSYTHFWTTTPWGAGDMCYMYFWGGNSLDINGGFGDWYGNSVRLVKDT